MIPAMKTEKTTKTMLKYSTEYKLLCAIAQALLPPPLTLGDIVVAFCDLPNHKQMEDAFVASRGRYSRRKFLEDFGCPGWAYDFLRTYCDWKLSDMFNAAESSEPPPASQKTRAVNSVA